MVQSILLNLINLIKIQNDDGTLLRLFKVE